MATPNDIIATALRKLKVIAAETDIEAAESADGLKDLNNIGAEHQWFEPVALVSDTLNITREMVGPLGYILADKIQDDYAASVMTPSLQKNIHEAYNAMYRLVNGKLDVKFPSTLPQGTGNDWNNSNIDERFFEQDKQNF